MNCLVILLEWACLVGFFYSFDLNSVTVVSVKVWQCVDGILGRFRFRFWNNEAVCSITAKQPVLAATSIQSILASVAD